MTKEESNLKRLEKSNLVANFVKKCNGEWDHEEWLTFCDSIKAKGYFPIDLDQVGLLLEKQKSECFSKQPCLCSK